jgi:hypothetical protein
MAPYVWKMIARRHAFCVMNAQFEGRLKRHNKNENYDDYNVGIDIFGCAQRSRQAERCHSEINGFKIAYWIRLKM